MENSAYHCVFKLRCSKGLQVTGLLSPWRSAEGTDDQSVFEVSRMTADAVATFTLQPEVEHEDGENWKRGADKRNLYIQAAVQYTNALGFRLLRVHTLQLNCVYTARAYFTSVSLDPLAALLIKQAAARALELLRPQASKNGPRSAADYMQEACLNILCAYRRHCYSSDISDKPLLIARQLMWLPLYTLVARKLFYAILGAGPDARTEVRQPSAWDEYMGQAPEEMLHRLLRMPVHTIVALLYPRVYAVSLPLLGSEDSNEVLAPKLLPVGAARTSTLVSDNPSLVGFVISNGLGMFLQRKHVPEEPLPSDEELWQAAQAVSLSLRDGLEPSPVWTPLEVLPAHSAQGRDAWQLSVLVSCLLVEDAGAADPGYAEWVEHLGKQVYAHFEAVCSG
jgi:hypothetical protein